MLALPKKWILEKLNRKGWWKRLDQERQTTVWEGIKLGGLMLFLTGAFFLGKAAGYLTGGTQAVSSESLLNGENWGLGFGAEGTQPTGNLSKEELGSFDAWYVGDDKEKVIYLTFDCGYEAGYTEAILDALQKHNAKAAFFVVGHYLESAPELVKRMVQEGHTVGNHSYHHPDMSAITDKEKFKTELTAVEQKFTEVTGEKMFSFFRPPQGKYSVQSLQISKELGYHTFFWSLAYVDWNKDAQPDPAESIQKLCKRIHPGAIVLLHNTSKTNAEILDELLTRWEEMGYRFGTLEELIVNSSSTRGDSQ